MKSLLNVGSAACLWAARIGRRRAREALPYQPLERPHRFFSTAARRAAQRAMPVAPSGTS